MGKLTGKPHLQLAISDSELPTGPNRVDDGAIRGSESANGVGVLVTSGDASEGGGGVVGEGGDDLTEEERETVGHVCVKRFDNLPNTSLITVTITN